MSPFSGIDDYQPGQTSQIQGTASHLQITNQSSFVNPQNQEVYSQNSQRGKKSPQGQIHIMENAQTFGKVSESHVDKTPKITSKIGSISSSTSICSQDLILFTDFLPLSEFIQMFCKGKHDFDVYGSSADNESLLNIQKIEHLLTNMGKNDVELRKSLREQQFMEKMKSSFTYEMNSLKVERQSLEKMMFKSSQGYLDQDMFIILLISSLFETQSISQIQQENNKFFEQPNQTDSFRLINIQFDQLIDESFGNNFSANEDAKTQEQFETFDQMWQSDRNQSQVLQIVHIAKQFLSGIKDMDQRQYKPLVAGSSLSRLGQDLADKQSKRQLMKGSQQKEQAQSMISLFNQLMIHQILQKKMYEQQVLNTSRIIKIQYQSVLEIQKLYVQQIITNYKNPGHVFDFTNLGNPQEKIKFKEYDPNTGLNTNDNTFQEQEQNQVMPLLAGQELAMAENQEYLENGNINQELVQAQNQFNTQIQKIQADKQKFLQKLIYQIATNHIDSEKIMLLKTNLLKEQKEEYLRQIETDDQKEVEGPKHKHRIEKNNTGNQAKFKNIGDDQFGDSNSKGASGNESLMLKNQPTSTDIQMTNINTQQKGFSTQSMSIKGVPSPNSQVTQSNEMGSNHHVSPILTKHQSQEQNEDNFYPSQTTVGKGLKQKHENIIDLMYSDAKSITEDEKRTLFQGQKRQSFTTEEKRKLKEAEAMKEWEQARLNKIIGELEIILIQNDFKIAVYYERFFHHAQEQKNILMMSSDLNKIEQLLYTCDLELLNQRQVLVKMLSSVENGMEDRENFIKDQLRQIAILEMQKGQEEDEMLDQTLKTIEIVNINDIGQEKEQLQYSTDILWNKKAELDKIEEDLQKERTKRDYKKSGTKHQQLKKRQTMLMSKDQDDSPLQESDFVEKSDFKLAAVPSGLK